MFIELHILQNFAPSNLNRDDTGAPKDCEFGGYRRARISSQCLKRAIRDTFKKDGLLPERHLAARTKRLVENLVERLAARGKDPDQARAVVEAALGGVGLSVKEDGKTQYLLFLGHAEMQAIADLCLERWDELTVPPAPPEATPSARARAGRDAKQAARLAVPPAVQAALKKLLDGGKAADLALFGRMLADLPDNNRDAACQMAHAISTNRVSMEMDFYTAVDDLKPDDTAGADMLGTVEFNSACFYRYANVDLAGLGDNLGGDEELARQTLDAFLRASISAVPTGKQNSMAAQNPPSLVFAVLRERGLWNLANAFVQPVRPTQQRDLVQGSIDRLDGYWGRLTKMYGQGGLVGSWASLLDDGSLEHLGKPVMSVDALVDGVLAAASFKRSSGNGLR